jgi:uracil-DNA glycosylase
MLSEVQDQMYAGKSYTRYPDLTRWANQGVLLLNTALTTTIGKTGTHYMLWQPFVVYVLDYLSWHNPGLIYAFLGKQAQTFMAGMTENNYKFIASHPASAAYNKLEKWDSQDLFKKISEQLHKSNGLKIEW